MPMLTARELPRPETYRPKANVLKRVHRLTRHKGKIAAIEPRSGDYFIGNDTLSAIQLARQHHPKAIFYIVRVGYASAHTQRSPNRRLGR